jgi:hypothetical protein
MPMPLVYYSVLNFTIVDILAPSTYKTPQPKWDFLFHFGAG